MPREPHTKLRIGALIFAWSSDLARVRAGAIDYESVAEITIYRRSRDQEGINPPDLLISCEQTPAGR
jgi:hypothetical protein